ncbi:hypothetical protein HELRODRAFT_174704 [Helobdella robusta]|uniref:Uncharacterized protein n=1 Tax=Helobdella robusta TaxID=6412 RepID=T1F8E1_HELRO|nr:hypothetical protein HELRODRAFT_174704 [Helobdella robusta]ESO01726.1 hypothetical protein HELRODRAFT_174704 [Helobdella robusta]
MNNMNVPSRSKTLETYADGNLLKKVQMARCSEGQTLPGHNSSFIINDKNDSDCKFTPDKNDSDCKFTPSVFSTPILSTKPGKKYDQHTGGSYKHLDSQSDTQFNQDYQQLDCSREQEINNSTNHKNINYINSKYKDKNNNNHKNINYINSKHSNVNNNKNINYINSKYNNNNNNHKNIIYINSK